VHGKREGKATLVDTAGVSHEIFYENGKIVSEYKGTVDKSAKKQLQEVTDSDMTINRNADNFSFSPFDKSA
jgi:hypothetical protein